jgi:hypothetical protein
VNDSAKRAVTVAFFSLGATLGLYGCAVTPKTIFVIGNNDSPLAALLGIPCLILFTPLCVFAFWKRRVAGICFFLLAVMWTSSNFLQYFFELSHRIKGVSLADSIRMLIFSVLFLVFAAFALVTETAGWPPLKKPRESD